MKDLTLDQRADLLCIKRNRLYCALPGAAPADRKAISAMLFRVEKQLAAMIRKIDGSAY